MRGQVGIGMAWRRACIMKCCNPRFQTENSLAVLVGESPQFEKDASPPHIPCVLRSKPSFHLATRTYTSVAKVCEGAMGGGDMCVAAGAAQARDPLCSNAGERLLVEA